MPAPPFYNTFDKGVSGASLTLADPGSGTQWTQLNTVGTEPSYSTTQRRGAMSMRLQEPGVGMGLCYIGYDTLGSLTTSAYFRTYMYLPALTANLYFLFGQGYTSGLVATATVGINPNGGVGTPQTLVMFDGTGAVITNGTAIITPGQWLRAEWRIKASTTVGEMEYRMFGADGQMIDRIVGSGLTLGADLDRMYFGNLGTAEASFTFWMDDIAASTDDWLGPAEPSFISSLGRRPVPMIKGPSLDRRGLFS